jgi:hypothetical protein
MIIMIKISFAIKPINKKKASFFIKRLQPSNLGFRKALAFCILLLFWLINRAIFLAVNEGLYFLRLAGILDNKYLAL